MIYSTECNLEYKLYFLLATRGRNSYQHTFLSHTTCAFTRDYAPVASRECTISQSRRGAFADQIFISKTLGSTWPNKRPPVIEH